MRCCWFGADFLMINKRNDEIYVRVREKEIRVSSVRYMLSFRTDGCLLIQSESIRRYIIIIYIDDDMMSHPVFFNQIIIVCINRRLWERNEREGEKYSGGRIRAIDWSRILFNRKYNLFVICSTFFSTSNAENIYGQWISLNRTYSACRFLFIYLFVKSCFLFNLACPRFIATTDDQDFRK